MSPFRKRDREELLQIVGKMADEFHQVAEAYRSDAAEQINGIERGTIADIDEAIHRAVNAISFSRLAQQMREIVGIAEGRRDATRWTLHRRPSD